MKLRIIALFIGLVSAAAIGPSLFPPLHAQVPAPAISEWNHRIGAGDNVCGGVDCYIVDSNVVEVAGAAATLTVVEGGGTNCASGPCYLAKSIAIQANSVQFLAWKGHFCKGGCVISGTGSMDGHIQWTTSTKVQVLQ